jgi:hypothetical protein
LSKRSPTGILAAAVVWIIIVGLIAVAYRFFLHPKLQERLRSDTGSDSRYTDEIRLAIDSFSGYCILRSKEFQQRLKSQGIKITYVDDGADYGERVDALQDREVQLAVFTIDSYLLACAGADQFPASIVMIIDETKGADAIIGYRQGAAELSDLNDPAARMVLTPRSPSEFLARVAIAHFSLPRLPDRWWIGADGADEVYDAFRSANPGDKKAYVMWEPYVSKALENKDAVVLLDSSKLKGYIVDVLVAERQFLRENPDKVRSVVEAYLRTSFAVGQSNGLVDLVVEDARDIGAKRIKKPQAERLVTGIHWKNTLENYAHFGLQAGSAGKDVTHIEDMILQVTDVLLRTRALTQDPLEDRAHTLFYRSILEDMQLDSFHPGREVNILSDVGPSLEDIEEIRESVALKPLSETEWEKLVRVGEINAPPVSFARGTARLHAGSRRAVAKLAEQMKTFPQFYLTVIGQSRAEGDPEANLALARSRADAVATYLVGEGLSENRIRATASPTSQRGGQAQSVQFVVGQRPY